MNWLPHLVILVGIVIWHFFFLKLPEDPNPPIMLLALFNSPLTALQNLAQTILRDVLHMLVSTWSRTVDVTTIELASKISIISWGIAILSTIFVGWFSHQAYPSSKTSQETKLAWHKQALVIGAFALLLGMIPAWTAGRQASGGLYSDRFALPAMVGASLLVAGLIEWLVNKNTQKFFSIALLVGLAIGTYFRVGNDYRRDWDFQKDFFWQLYWRAPTIKPDTALLSEGGIFQYVTKYSLSAAINTLYPVMDNTTTLPYWSFELDELANPDLDPEISLNGVVLMGSQRNLNFSAPSDNSILISYQREKFHCLWILSSIDAANPYLQKYSSLVVDSSNLDRILPEPSNSNYPDLNIFGPEPPHNWCYYFQKADLARQFGKWEEIVKLGNEVIELEYGPSNSFEWIPFIEGYIHQRNWEKAVDLTRASFENDPKLRASLCSTWKRAVQTTPLSVDEQTLVNSTLAEIGCVIP